MNLKTSLIIDEHLKSETISVSLRTVRKNLFQFSSEVFSPIKLKYDLIQLHLQQVKLNENRKMIK